MARGARKMVRKEVKMLAKKQTNMAWEAMRMILRYLTISEGRDTF